MRLPETIAKELGEAKARMDGIGMCNVYSSELSGIDYIKQTKLQIESDRWQEKYIELIAELRKALEEE